MVADLITYLMWITINEWELRSVVVTEYLCTYLGWTKIVDLNSKTIILVYTSLSLCLNPKAMPPCQWYWSQGQYSRSREKVNTRGGGRGGRRTSKATSWLMLYTSKHHNRTHAAAAALVVAFLPGTHAGEIVVLQLPAPSSKQSPKAYTTTYTSALAVPCHCHGSKVAACELLF